MTPLPSLPPWFIERGVTGLGRYITDDGMVRNDTLPATGTGLPGHDDAKAKGIASVVPKFREIRKK